MVQIWKELEIHLEGKVVLYRFVRYAETEIQTSKFAGGL